MLTQALSPPHMLPPPLLPPGMLTQTLYIFGEFFLVALAYACSGSWRALTLSVAAACLAVVPLAIAVPESPRWLLLAGRPGDAAAALAWVARLNGRPAPRLRCTAVGEVLLLLPLLPGRGADVGDGPDVYGGEAGIDAAQLPCAEEAEQGEGADGNGGAGGGATRPALDPNAGCGLPRCGASPAAAAPTCAGCCYCIGRAAGAAGLPAGSRPSLPATSQADDGSGCPAAVNSCGSRGGGAGGGGLVEALRHPTSRSYLLSTLFIMFSLSVAYFGISLALGTLSGSLRLNFLLMAAAELPAYLVGGAWWWCCCCMPPPPPAVAHCCCMYALLLLLLRVLRALLHCTAACLRMRTAGPGEVAVRWSKWGRRTACARLWGEARAVLTPIAKITGARFLG